ncbi:hypothetical protein P3T37_006752 [Kitasatospora sp. MAA4]|nr:hypothetical protein [Kitasatospora sp. MAA4]
MITISAQFGALFGHFQLIYHAKWIPIDHFGHRV